MHRLLEDFKAYRSQLGVDQGIALATPPEPAQPKFHPLLNEFKERMAASAPTMQISEPTIRADHDRTFLQNVQEEYRRGSTGMNLAVAMYEAAGDEQAEARVQAARRKLAKEMQLDPIEGNFLTNLVYKAARGVAPSVFQGLWQAKEEAAAGMVAGAGFAAAAGQAGPQIALPEEAVTVPVGAATGLAIGAKMGMADYFYKVGAGEMYGDLLDMDLPRDIARSVSRAAGVPYALIEMTQVGQATPGLREGMRQVGKKAVLNVVRQAMKKYGKTWSQEVAEEVGQAAVAISAEKIASYAAGKGARLSREQLRADAMRLWEEGKEAAQAMALVPLPGAMVDLAATEIETTRQAPYRPMLPKKTPTLPQEGKTPVGVAQAPPEAETAAAGEAGAALPAAGEVQGAPKPAAPKKPKGQVYYHGALIAKEVFEGGEYFTDDPSAASAYAEMKALEEAVENNEELNEIVSDVISEEGAEAITDLSPDTIRNIIDANKIEVDIGEGVVTEAELDFSNPLDLTEYGSSVGGEGYVKQTWNDLNKQGLIDESWESLDEDVQRELEDKYADKALYRLLEDENVFKKAFDKGHDAVIFVDQTPYGDHTHKSFLVKGKEQIRRPPAAGEATKRSAVMPEHGYAAPGIIKIKSTIGEIHVPEATLEGKYGQDLETVFGYGNFQGNLEQPNLKRSLSVGDAIRYRDHVFAILPQGWRDVTGLSKDELRAVLGSENLTQLPAIWTLAQETPDVDMIVNIEVKPDAPGEAQAEGLATAFAQQQQAMADQAVADGEMAPSEQQVDAALEQQLGQLKGGLEATEPATVSLAEYSAQFAWDKAKGLWKAMRRFGAAELEDKEFAAQAEKSFGRRNNAIERAIGLVEGLFKAPKVSTEQAAALTMGIEDLRKTEQLPAGLKPVAKKILGILRGLEKNKLALGLLREPFQDRMVAQFTDELVELEEKQQSKLGRFSAKRQERINQLKTDIENVQNMQYLPHSIVAQRVMERKLREIKGSERPAFIDKMNRFSAKYKLRKGRAFLADYLEEGLLTEDDIDIRRVLTDSIYDYFQKIANKSLLDYGKRVGYVTKAESPQLHNELTRRGWINQREAGLTIPEYKDHLIHPLMAATIKGLIVRFKPGPLRKNLNIVKVWQFIKPTIIPVYNVFQAIIKGMLPPLYRPITTAKMVAESVVACYTKNALYNKLNDDNLYQFPAEVTRQTRQEMVQMMIDRTTADKNLMDTFRKVLQRATGRPWKSGEIGPIQILSAALNAIARVTWGIDDVQRTLAYLSLRYIGIKHDEAVHVASRGGGAYSAVSEKYKQVTGDIFFVMTFRMLMPIELAKTWVEPVAKTIRHIQGKEKVSLAQARRMANAIIGTVLLPIVIDAYMRHNGWEREGKHLGPLAWKYKKLIKRPDGSMREVIVGIDYILNMPIKYWERASQFDPLDRKSRFAQAFWRMARFEIHPVWRVIADVYSNQRSFGQTTSPYVFNPNGTASDKLSEIMGYVAGQFYRMSGAVFDAVSEGKMNPQEAELTLQAYKQAFNDLDKILFDKNFGLIGYSYQRKSPLELQAIRYRTLDEEYRLRRGTLHKSYEGSALMKRLEQLDKWHARALKWIEEEMR